MCMRDVEREGDMCEATPPSEATTVCTLRLPPSQAGCWLARCREGARL